jgi:capsular exopolysaccharide synthesis family protein
MSKFFKALQQAEADRARAEQASSPAALTKEPPVLRATPRADVTMATASADEVAAPVLEAAPIAVHPSSVRPSPERTMPVGTVEEHLVSLLTPNSLEAEQYRSLRTLLEVERREKGPLVIAVSSPGVGDGKTTTAINLAGVFGEAEESRVVLLDADLRNPSIARKLGLKQSSGGLAEALLNRSASLDGLVTHRPPYRLDLVLAWESTATPYELLKSRAFSDLLNEARRSYDFVIIDAPPIVSLPDCRLLGNMVDGFIIVVAANRTPRKLLEEALNALNPEMVLGLVFNNDQEASRYASYYGYYAGRGAKSKIRSADDGR